MGVPCGLHVPSYCDSTTGAAGTLVEEAGPSVTGYRAQLCAGDQV